MLSPEPEAQDKVLDKIGILDENQQQTLPTYETVSGNRTRATLVGGEFSHHCSSPK